MVMLERTEMWSGLFGMKYARCRSNLNELVAIWSMSPKNDSPYPPANSPCQLSHSEFFIRHIGSFFVDRPGDPSKPPTSNVRAAFESND